MAIWNGKIKKIVQQFLKFGIVGFSNTAISLGVYYILVYFGIQPLIANAFGFVVSVINAYYWNSKYVFKEKTETSNVKAITKVVASYGISFFVSSILIELFVDVLHISKYIAPLLRLLVTVPLNFYLNKKWAFKEK